MLGKGLCLVTGLILFCGNAMATPFEYDFGGTEILIDYVADDGSENPDYEAVFVVDWNDTHGPYQSTSHAWLFQWSGSLFVKNAMEAIDAAGAVDFEYAYGGGFIGHISYYDPAIDADNHVTTDYHGWAYRSASNDGGQTWVDPVVGVDADELLDGQIQAINFNPGTYTFANFNLPEPTALALLGLGSIMMVRRRKA